MEGVSQGGVVDHAVPPLLSNEAHSEPGFVRPNVQNICGADV